MSSLSILKRELLALGGILFDRFLVAITTPVPTKSGHLDCLVVSGQTVTVTATKTFRGQLVAYGDNFLLLQCGGETVVVRTDDGHKININTACP